MKYYKEISLKNGQTCCLRNGKGFNSRLTGFQEVVYMRLELG